MGKLVIANWKMHPRTEREAVRLARAEDVPGVVVAAPFPYLAGIGKALRQASLGAQDVSPTDARTGPMTGEVSGAMLSSLGVRYVLIGHSERRNPLSGKGESDSVIAAKVCAALDARITPVLCVGEPWNIRQRGFASSRAYVKKQVVAGFAKCGGRNLRCLVAYEPIWAISTLARRRIATPEEAAAMGSYLLAQLEALSGTRKGAVLYGGSVSVANAAAFLMRPEFSGVLVGGASLDAPGLRRIARAAADSKSR